MAAVRGRGGADAADPGQELARRHGHRAEPALVAVGQAALAGEAHEAALDLLVDLLVGVARLVGVRDRRLREGDEDLRRAGRQRARLLERPDGRLVEVDEARHPAAELAGGPAELVAAEQGGRLPQERRAVAEHRLGAAHARQRRLGEGPRRRQRVVDRVQRRVGDVEQLAQRRDARLQRGALAREGGGGRGEVRDEPLERLLVARERRGGPLPAAQHARDVVVGVLAERGLAGDRPVAVGLLPVLRRLAEARGALAVERLRVLVEEGLEVLAGVGLERRQHLAEVDRRGRLRGGDRVVVVLQLGRRRRAGTEVDEGVALEEDARADLERRVAVDRQALVGDLHLDEAALAALERLDLRHLADVDAGDAHGRARLDVAGVLEGRREREGVGERVALREAEPAPDRDDGDRDEAGGER